MRSGFYVQTRIKSAFYTCSVTELSKLPLQFKRRTPTAKTENEGQQERIKKTFLFVQENVNPSLNLAGNQV